jgi:anhydro-N-acetylmuramic acid kinase
MTKKSMIVAGVMSGTSADGINVALVRMHTERPVWSEHPCPLPLTLPSDPRKRGTHKNRSDRFQLIGHAEYSYPKKVRAAVLASMNASRASVADLARLNFLLGELYADAVLATQRQFRVKADLIGCHGQTLYHQGEPARFLGRKLAATWQTGEPAIIAARVGTPVVSDYRPADLAAGGKGAPLVPFLDYLLFRDTNTGRIVQNIGGIANLTVIPAGATPRDVIAFDTGPGNMVIDAVTDYLFHQPFDRGGRIAATGKVQDKVIHKILQRDFFRKAPPKTAGREEFGGDFVREFLQACGRRPKQDIVATATALTAKSIADAIRRYATQNPTRKQGFHEMILSGGGAKNSTLVSMLTSELSSLGLRIRFSDEFGLPSAAKEAVAFAVLACETWHRRASNVPSATGAQRPAILGKISYP